MNSDLYPKLSTQALEQKLETRLKQEYEYNSAIANVNEIQRFLKKEIKIYESKYKKCKRLNYISLALQAVGIVSGAGVAIPVAATGIGVPEAIIIEGSVLTAVGLVNIVSDYIFNRYKRRHYKR